jgi:putative SOS response-associated peptidase YedK
MCGRYALNLTPEEIERRFGITEFVQLRLPPVMPRFNVAPTSVMPIVVERPEARMMLPSRWGFWPPWIAPGRAPPPINARAETVAAKGLFRTALQHGRCIVPATGFYEWVVQPGQRRKAPYHIRLRGGEPFGFAGIYSPPTDEAPGTYAIITTSANELIAPLHDRMPVILAPEQEARWLDPATTEPAEILPLLARFPAARLEAYGVGEAVGGAANDREELIAPLA